MNTILNDSMLPKVSLRVRLMKLVASGAITMLIFSGVIVGLTSGAAPHTEQQASLRA